MPTKSLENQIGELEALVRSVKAVKDSDRGKSYVEDMEADLKNLREQQKRARPLPARLQAATARAEKTKAAAPAPAKALSSSVAPSDTPLPNAPLPNK